jgi:hypothetical protein
VAARTSGGNFWRGLLIAALIVVVGVLLIVFRVQLYDGVRAVGHFVSHRAPTTIHQKSAVGVYLILAAIAGFAFSRAGHLTAYGIATGLGVLLWIVFWEGLPLLGLRSNLASSLGLGHLSPTQVLTWAIIAALVTTAVFWPFELAEKRRRSS